LKPLSIIYWSRVCFGVVAALFCALLGIKNLLNGMSVGILVYLSTYYVLKGLFITKVEKPSKIFTMGIGAYFITWIVAWVLFYTLMVH
jgi:hypothetical protein